MVTTPCVGSSPNSKVIGCDGDDTVLMLLVISTRTHVSYPVYAVSEEHTVPSVTVSLSSGTAKLFSFGTK
jgi:hypothetical protein